MTDDPKIPQDAEPTDPDSDDGIYQEPTEEDPELAKTDVPGQDEPDQP
jgi:hypothetical protein